MSLAQLGSLMVYTQPQLIRSTQNVNTMKDASIRKLRIRQVRVDNLQLNGVWSNIHAEIMKLLSESLISLGRFYYCIRLCSNFLWTLTVSQTQ